MRRHNGIWSTHVGQEILVLVYALLMCKLVIQLVKDNVFDTTSDSFLETVCRNQALLNLTFHTSVHLYEMMLQCAVH